MRLQRMPNFAVEQPLARIRLPRLSPRALGACYA
jgi:hypothetical protein